MSPSGASGRSRPPGARRRAAQGRAARLPDPGPHRRVVPTPSGRSLQPGLGRNALWTDWDSVRPVFLSDTAAPALRPPGVQSCIAELHGTECAAGRSNLNLPASQGFSKSTLFKSQLYDADLNGRLCQRTGHAASPATRGRAAVLTVPCPLPPPGERRPRRAVSSRRRMEGTGAGAAASDGSVASESSAAPAGSPPASPSKDCQGRVPGAIFSSLPVLDLSQNGLQHLGDVLKIPTLKVSGRVLGC